MANKKCPQCGLVNWINAESCKRCKAPLIQAKETAATDTPVKDTPVADSTVRSDQPAPELAVCSVCGTAHDVTVWNITRKHSPNWVWIFLPLGILPAGLLGLALQVKHSFSLPVCRRCMVKRSWAGVVSWVSIILCIFIFISAAGFALQEQSWMTFLISMAIVIAIAAFAGWFDKKANPRYAAFTKERVEIDVPGQGRILILDLKS
jgi:ribosomal protein L40E